MHAHSHAGSVVEKTFRAGEQLDGADLSRRANQYTYAEGDTYVFMVRTQGCTMSNCMGYEACKLVMLVAWPLHQRESEERSLSLARIRACRAGCSCFTGQPPSAVAVTACVTVCGGEQR
jgi:hypothetical protein